MGGAFDFDPFDPAYWDDPYPWYAQMRQDHPVFRRPTPFGRVWPHYWMLTRSEDVNAALADWRTFSSAEGVLVDTNRAVLNSDQPPLLFDADPPRHDEIRSVLSRVFDRAADRRHRAARAPLRRRAGRRLRADRGLRRLHPVRPADPDHHHVQPARPAHDGARAVPAWNLDTLGGNDFASPAAQKAWAEMGEYWVDIVPDRRDHPSTDLISQILHAQSGGDVEISDPEVSAFCGLLHDASQNTTMNMITLAVVSLAKAPDQRRRLSRHPEIWPQAIEELLRFVSPVQGLARCTTRDVTLHGVTIPEGDQVLLLFGSANHDDTVFDRPDVLDVDRPAGRHHWTFGHGIHHCLGNAVAKLETRVAVQVLLERLGEWDLDGVIERTQLVPTRGVAHAPIGFAPAA